MRKDVECTFGILKGRFRILKTGIRLHGTDAADKIWMTCCALHNWLLEVDGLSEGWESGTRSEWEGELGDNDTEDIENYFDRSTGARLPEPLHRLRNPARSRGYADSSGMGPGDDVEHDDPDGTEADTSDNVSEDGVRVVDRN